MKLAWLTALFLLLFTSVASLPAESLADLQVVEGSGEHLGELEKRRGGSHGGESHSSRSGDSRSKPSSDSTSKTSSSSNTGGTTQKGSGTVTSYGGGRYGQYSTW